MSSSCFSSEPYLTKAKSTLSPAEGFLWQKTEINISILGLGTKQGILLVFAFQEPKEWRSKGPVPGVLGRDYHPSPSKSFQAHANPQERGNMIKYYTINPSPGF